MNYKKYLSRLKNPGTVISIVSGIIFLLTEFGIQIESEKILESVRVICSIGLAMGIMNNPDTPGVDLPITKKI